MYTKSAKTIMYCNWIDIKMVVKNLDFELQKKKKKNHSKKKIN